jgi:hypothetical protein
MRRPALCCALLLIVGTFDASGQTMVLRQGGSPVAAASAAEGAFRNAHCDAFMSSVEPPEAEVTPEGRRLAREANRLGMKAYRDGRHDDASDLFYCATRCDPNHASAHYNLAREYVRDLDGMCDVDLVWREVGAAFRLDHARRERFLRDPDFEPIRRTLYFRMIAGDIDLDSDEAIARVLLDQRPWIWGTLTGADVPYVEFLADGTARQRYSFAYDPADPATFTTWTWLVRDGRVLMTREGRVVEWRLTFDEERGVWVTDEHGGKWGEVTSCDV